AHRARELHGPAEAKVAAAVDGVAVAAGKCLAGEVGEQPFRDSAAVEADAGRARDRPSGRVERDLRPASARIRRRRLPRRRAVEADGQGERLVEIAPVAGVLDLADQSRVDETARAPG